jgi:hypothetical protein
MSEKKESNELKAFEKLSDALDVEFENEEITAKAVEIKKSTKNIVDTLNKDEWSLDDKAYMEFEIKETIENIDSVMGQLRSDIKIGTPPRTHEVYATLAKIKIDALKELRELNRSVIDMKVAKAKTTGSSSSSGSGNIQVNNYNMSSSELLKMVKNAKNNNSMNEIEAKFQIDEKDVSLSSQKE